MPCYVNPDAAFHEREMCEQRWRFFQVVSAAQNAGIEWDSKTAAMILEEREKYISHRKEDRDFLINYLDGKEKSDRNQAIKDFVTSLSDDELISTYWGTWEDEQLADGVYRGQVMSAAAHPPAPHISL